MGAKFFDTIVFAAEIRRGVAALGLGSLSPVAPERAPLPIHRFDLTTHDGRVYRVRVSDITPEKESVT